MHISGHVAEENNDNSHFQAGTSVVINEPLDDEASRFYRISEIDTRFNKRFNLEEKRYFVHFTGAGKEQENVIDTLFGVLEHLIYRLLNNLDHNDRVMFTLSNPGKLDYPIQTRLMRAGEFSLEDILDEIQKVLQSNEDFVIGDDLLIRLVIIQLPVGGKSQRRSVVAKKWLKKSRSVVVIKNRDNLCLARSIGVCIAHLINNLYKHNWLQQKPDWVSANPLLETLFWGGNKYTCMRHRSRPQEKFALWFHEKADIPTTNSCGVDECVKFQNVLTTMGIALKVFSQPYAGAIIFRGPKELAHSIYVYHREQHFDSIIAVTGFLKRCFFCTHCEKGYDVKYVHRCKYICAHCYRTSPGGCKGDFIQCKKCHRYFAGADCLKSHNVNKICKIVQNCPNCNEFLRGSPAIREHICGRGTCRVCKEEYTAVDHKCYMQPLLDPFQSKRKKRPRTNTADQKNLLTDAEPSLPFTEETILAEVEDNTAGADTCGDAEVGYEAVFDPDKFQYIFFDLETYCEYDPDRPDMQHKVIIFP